MSSRKSLVLGCAAAFLAGSALTHTAGHLTARAHAADGVPGLIVERGKEGVVFRTTIPGKDFAVLVEAGRDRSGITFHQESLALDLRGEATARIYDLRRLMECRNNDCRPCQPGPEDACVVPPVPVPTPGPGRGYQLNFLSARR